MDNSQRMPTAICSAVVCDSKGRIGVKDAQGPAGLEGLSLLGGHIQWGHGVTEGLRKRIWEESKIGFTPSHLVGITRHRTPSKKDVINISVAATLDDSSIQEHVYWMTVDEILRREDEFRTPDGPYLVVRSLQGKKVPLDFVQYTDILHPVEFSEDKTHPISTELASGGERFGPTDFVVTSTAARYQGPEGGVEYMFMRCGRERFEGKFSNLGGKLDRDESVKNGAMREVQEETPGIDIKQVGLTGIFINRIDPAHNPPEEYAVNFATLAICRNKYQLPVNYSGREVEGIEWIDVEKIPGMSNHEFRTVDTKRAVTRSEAAHQRNEIVPFDFIHDIAA